MIVCILSSFMFELKSFIIGNCQQTLNCHNKFDVKIDYRNDNQQNSVDSIELLNNCESVCVCRLLLLFFRLIVYTHCMENVIKVLHCFMFVCLYFNLMFVRSFV